MAFDLGLIPVIIVSVLIVVLVTLFFHHFGAFKHHWVCYSMMLLSAYIPYIMVIGILPYDISKCRFEHSETHSKALYLVLNTLYWVSFVLTWIINPLIVSYLRYPYSLTLKRRIWLTIRENLIFWGIIVGIVIIGVIILLCSHQMTASNLIPLGISLANGYGLILLCLSLGYGFVAFPRQIWNDANPATSYLYRLQAISKETEICSSTVADGVALLSIFQTAQTQIKSSIIRQIWNDKAPNRKTRLENALQEVKIPSHFKQGRSKNRKIKKFEKVKWDSITESRIEDFFELMDDTIQNIEATTFYVEDAAQKAYRKLQLYNSSWSSTVVIAKRASVFFIIAWNLICIWGEIALMFNNRFSIFYILAEAKIPTILNIVFISMPILSYLMFVGTWSLRHVRLGSFFRFIASNTNANTLNYFSIILCRLGPTIGFHYMQQIGAYNSEFQKVMGVMDVVVFVGTKWNIYSPILMFIVIICTCFNLLDKLRLACGKDPLTYDQSVMDMKRLEAGQEVLAEILPEARLLIEANLTYMVIWNNTSIFKKNNKSNISENLLSSDQAAPYMRAGDL